MHYDVFVMMMPMMMMMSMMMTMTMMMMTPQSLQLVDGTIFCPHD
jgi:hypothetical protein